MYGFATRGLIPLSKTDNEIDQMVYALYGLSDEEIQIVENN